MTQTKHLTHDEMRLVMTKIDRRIDELKQFDVATISDNNDPNIEAFHQKLIKLLIEIYGDNTPAFPQHKDLANLEIPDLTVGHNPSIQDIRNKIKKRIGNAIIQLESIKNDFTEELNDASDGNSIQRILSAYQ